MAALREDARPRKKMIGDGLAGPGPERHFDLRQRWRKGQKVCHCTPPSPVRTWRKHNRSRAFTQAGREQKARRHVGLSGCGNHLKFNLCGNPGSVRLGMPGAILGLRRRPRSLEIRSLARGSFVASFIMSSSNRLPGSTETMPILNDCYGGDSNPVRIVERLPHRSNVADRTSRPGPSSRGVELRCIRDPVQQACTLQVADPQASLASAQVYGAAGGGGQSWSPGAEPLKIFQRTHHKSAGLKRDFGCTPSVPWRTELMPRGTVSVITRL
ncbi:hypothetical protein FHX16_004158 [Rhizobium sp. BK661]|nr:hypothetical protein [Rhizobium sp. BK661]